MATNIQRMFGGKNRRYVRRQMNRPQRAMPILKSAQEIQIMREAGRIVAKVHAALREAIRPGVTTQDLDDVAFAVLQKYNAVSAFLGYRGYPANICASVNDELVHGIPSPNRVLAEGDVISVDVGSQYRGFVGDSAWTYAVGAISEDAQELMRVTEASLYAGIEQARPGNKVVDVSRAVQRVVEEHGFYIVREYTGHGVGRQMHEPPQVLNYVSGDADGEYVLEPGVVFAIEPMVQFGTARTRTLNDKWTVVSEDGSLAAHFEHTVAVTNHGPEILTLP